MTDMQERLELAFITIILAGATFMISQHKWKIRWLYFTITLMFGIVVGTIANRTPALHDWDYVITGIASLLGPALLLWLRGKTLDDIIDEVGDMRSTLNLKKDK